MTTNCSNIPHPAGHALDARRAALFGPRRADDLAGLVVLDDLDDLDDLADDLAGLTTSPTTSPG